MSLASPNGLTAAPTARDARRALVTALATVPGLLATPAMPDIPVAGAAWPVWVQGTYNGRLGAPSVRSYDCLIVLPAGYLPDTVDQSDGLVDQVVAALWPVAVVQTAEPVLIQFDNTTTMPGLRVRVVART